MVFRLYPFFASLYYSFTFFPILDAPKWVGLDNYLALLDDTRFITGLYNTAYYALFAVPLAALMGVLLAMLLNARSPRPLDLPHDLLPAQHHAGGRHGHHLAVDVRPHQRRGQLLPVAGGHPTGPAWLGSPQWSKPALIIMSLWTVGGAVVIYLASLQDVPRELLEAADLDGATAARKVWHVTLPMISPVILFNVIVGLIAAFQYFVEPWVMSNGTGSPADSLLMMSMYLYQSAFQFFKIGLCLGPGVGAVLDRHRLHRRAFSACRAAWSIMAAK